MSISAIGSSPSLSHQLPAKPQVQQTAPDGDSAAVESTESAATKRAEQQGGGVASNAVPPTPASRVNRLV